MESSNSWDQGLEDFFQALYSSMRYCFANIILKTKCNQSSGYQEDGSDPATAKVNQPRGEVKEFCVLDCWWSKDDNICWRQCFDLLHQIVGRRVPEKVSSESPPVSKRYFFSSNKSNFGNSLGIYLTVFLTWLIQAYCCFLTLKKKQDPYMVSFFL